jgi:hypothetical protein
MKKSLLFLFVALLFQACVKENEVDKFPEDGCYSGSLRASYSLDIRPILDANCIRCHNENNPPKGYNLKLYADVSRAAQNNLLFNVVNHTAGFSKMPAGADKLVQCDIDKIRKWIENGALND